MPMDIEDDRYHHYSTHFRYITTLDSALQTREDVRLTPAPDSEELRRFCDKMGVQVKDRLYIIYVIEEVRYLPIMFET